MSSIMPNAGSPLDPPGDPAHVSLPENPPMLIEVREALAAAPTLPRGFRCPECGYDLSNAPVPRCSECGRNIAPIDLALFESLPHERRRTRRQVTGRIIQTAIVWVALAIPLTVLGAMAWNPFLLIVSLQMFLPIVAGFALPGLFDRQSRQLFMQFYFGRIWWIQTPWLSTLALIVLLMISGPIGAQGLGHAVIAGLCVLLTAVWGLINISACARVLMHAEWHAVTAGLSVFRRTFLTLCVLGLLFLWVPTTGLLLFVI